MNVGLNLMTENHPSPDTSRPQFPAHKEPRVWVITAGDSPIGISVARQLLTHGDYALLGLAHSDLDRDETRRDGFEAFMAEVESHRDEGWGDRLKSVPLDIRYGWACNKGVHDMRGSWLNVMFTAKDDG